MDGLALKLVKVPRPLEVLFRFFVLGLAPIERRKQSYAALNVLGIAVPNKRSTWSNDQ